MNCLDDHLRLSSVLSKVKKIKKKSMFQEQNLQQKSLFDPIYDLDYGYNMGT